MLGEKNGKWVFDFSRCTSVPRKKWNDCQLLSFFYSRNIARFFFKALSVCHKCSSPHIFATRWSRPLILGLRYWVAKIQGLENQSLWQRLVSFVTVKTYSSLKKKLAKILSSNKERRQKIIRLFFVFISFLIFRFTILYDDIQVWFDTTREPPPS